VTTASNAAKIAKFVEDIFVGLVEFNDEVGAAIHGDHPFFG
jgi:hypothetical protein